MIIGISGHQDLGGSEDVGWIRSALDSVLRERRPDLGLTSLAAGADQLFAEVLISRGIAFDIIIPCANYELAFQGKTVDGYIALSAKARKQVTLSFSSPSEAAFLAAGQRIVHDCDLLISVWDGEPARGRGGTAEIVAYALKLGREVLHIDPVRRHTRQLQSD
jgi:hypothetical protein